MSGFISNCQATLFRRIGAAEGRSTYDGGSSFPVFFMERYRSSVDGNTEELSEVLLPPGAEPSPGDQLEIGGRRRVIAEVRRCVSLRGGVRAFRCGFLR